MYILHSKSDSSGKLVGMVKFDLSLHRRDSKRNRNQELEELAIAQFKRRVPWELVAVPAGVWRIAFF
jgi:hypothetical protein